MQQDDAARMLQIHISEGDRFEGKPLYEAIVERCREMKIAGATVFRGLEGYGETGAIHKPHLGRHDQPIVILIVDSPQNVERLMPAVEEMMGTGVLAMCEVRVVRVQKHSTGHEPERA